MASLMEVDYYDDASRGFGASLFVKQCHGNIYEDGWKEKGWLMTSPRPLMFTVVHYKKFAAKHFGASIGQYKCVLMDGGKCMFKAQFNTGVSHKLRGEDITPGALITVERYHWIWQGAEYSKDDYLEGEVARGVMIIDAFSWKEAPVRDTVDAEGSESCTCVSVDFEVEFLDVSFVNQVFQLNSLFFMEDTRHEEEAGVVYLSPMCFSSIKKGLFIDEHEVGLRNHWVSSLKKRARDEDEKKEDDYLDRHRDRFSSCHTN